MNPERGLAAAAALCEYFAPILRGPSRRTQGRHDQPPRRGRDRRREAHRRGDLLVPAAAPARRCGDHVSVAGEPALRVALGHLAARRGPGRPLTASAGHRGSGAVESAAADHHPDHHLRYRARRGAHPRGVFGAADARFDESARGSVGRTPTSSTSSARPRAISAGATASTCVSACTSRGSRCARPSTFCWTGCPTFGWTPTATTPTSAGRCSARRRRCRCCSTRWNGVMHSDRMMTIAGRGMSSAEHDS